MVLYKKNKNFLMTKLLIDHIIKAIILYHIDFKEEVNEI